MLLSLWVMTRAARLYLRELHPAWLLVPVAFHPLLVHAATEIRWAGLALLLSSLLLFLFHRAYLSEQPRRRDRVLYVVVATLALYSQYYLGFLLAAGGAVLLAQRRWHPLRDYVLQMIVAAVLFVPLVVLILGQVTAYDNISNAHSPLQSFQHAYWRVADYLLPAEGETMQVVRIWPLRALLLVTVVAAARSWHRLKEPGLLTLLVLVGVLLLFYLAVLFTLGHMLMEYRHTIFLFWPLLLMLYAVVNAGLGRRGVAVLSLLLLGFSATAVALKYRPLAKTGDWIRVAQHLMAAEQDNQPVLVFKAECVHPLRIYYRGRNTLLPLPREPNLETTWDAAADVLQDDGPILAAIRKARGGSGQKTAPSRFWLVTNKGRQWGGIVFNRENLDTFVAEHFAVEQRRTFYRSEVKLLRLRTPALLKR